MNANNRANIKSMDPKNMLVNAITISTIMVNCVACLRVGQLTLRNSAIVSRKYRTIPGDFLREAVFATFFLLRIARRRPRAASCFGQTGQAGIEPTTPGFGDRCSAKLSYWPSPGNNTSTSSRDVGYAPDIAGNISSTPNGQDRFFCFSRLYNFFPGNRYILA